MYAVCARLHGHAHRRSAADRSGRRVRLRFDAVGRCRIGSFGQAGIPVLAWQSFRNIAAVWKPCRAGKPIAGSALVVVDEAYAEYAGAASATR
jgi:hypothetical protein